MRKFIPFDEDTIIKEMRSLPDVDFAALKHAMSSFAKSDDLLLPPAMVEDQHKYGAKFKPIMKCRHRSGSHQGRALFYFGPRLHDYEPLVVLLVYEKEKDELPRNLLESAYDRMIKHQGEK